VNRTEHREAFRRGGGRTLAIDPKALGFEWFFGSDKQSDPEIAGDTAIVKVIGPLEHHRSWFFESYDELVERMGAAFRSGAKRVLLSMDSPGGVVSGLFDTCRELRRLADESGKPYDVYVDGQCCSAAMAIACSADRILTPEEAVLGSIGVIAELENEVEAAEKYGVRFTLITSGARKADGHPMAPVTEEMVAAIQSSVDYEAGLFWAWVSERRSVPVETIKSFEAGIFHGQQAIDAKLADGIATYSGALAMVAKAPAGNGDETPGGAASRNARNNTMAKTAKESLDEARKLLGDAASDDSEEGRRARKMLDAADTDAAEGEEDNEEDPPADHQEPDGDEGEDEGEEDEAEDDAEDSEADDDAEGDDEASSAEDSDSDTDAKRAKKCEDDAKKAEDDAKKADTDAKKAAKAGKSKAALAAMNRRDKLNAKARGLRRAADQYRSNAAVHARLAKLERAPRTPAPSSGNRNMPQNPAVAGLKSRGKTGAGQGKPPASNNVRPISSVPKSMLRAAGLIRQTDQTIVHHTDGAISLGALSPEQAKARKAQLAEEQKGLVG
jgi:signal peptide peptidase SppA